MALRHIDCICCMGLAPHTHWHERYRKRRLNTLLTGRAGGSQTSRTWRSRAKPTRQWVPSPGSMVAVRLLMRTMVPTTVCRYLSSKAGAALTFWQHATEAIKVHGANGVDWADVERKTIVESISEHGQPPSDVADVICQHSPGAVSKARQDEVRALVDGLAPELQAQYAKARSEKRCEP